MDTEFVQIQHWCELIDAERQKRILESNTSLETSVEATRAVLQNLSMSMEKRQQDFEIKLEDALRLLDQPLQRFVDNLNDIHDKLGRTQRLEVLRWLSMVPYRQHHRNSMSDVLDQSGTWLKNHSIFRDWCRSSSSAILWLHGIRTWSW